MKRTWILVANRSRARLFVGCDDDSVVAELDAFDNPGASSCEHDGSAPPTSAATAAHPEIEARFARRFALTLDAVLDQGRADRRYDRLVLAAPASFMAVLRETLSTPVRRKLVGELDGDLIALTPPAIAARVCGALRETA